MSRLFPLGGQSVGASASASASVLPVNIQGSFLLGLISFPAGSAGKESTCHVGDPDSIPELERSGGEEIGYPLHHSWASLVAQLVKNPSAMRETWV